MHGLIASSPLPLLEATEDKASDIEVEASNGVAEASDIWVEAGKRRGAKVGERKWGSDRGTDELRVMRTLKRAISPYRFNLRVSFSSTRRLEIGRVVGANNLLRSPTPPLSSPALLMDTRSVRWNWI